jgi:hypothetical protein
MKKLTVTLLACLVLGHLSIMAFAQETPPAGDPNQPATQDTPAPESDQPQDQQAEPVQPPPPAVPTPVTLGAFVIKVAAGLNLPAPTSGFTPESAAWALILKGIKVRAELASSLTEADAVGVLTGLGYRIRTATPSRVMTSDRVDILLKTFLPPDKA